MKHPTPQKKIKHRTLGVFALVFALLLAVLALLNHGLVKQEKLKAAYTAESTVANIEAQLNRYLAESELLKNVVESGYAINDKDFAALSELMSDKDGVIKAVELAPNGIVQYIYPLAENKGVIGLNMLQHPERKVEANLAKDSGQYTIAGPFELLQGGTGALLFDPIYTTDENGNQKYWGFSLLVLDWKSFLDEVQITKLADASYEYRIWKDGYDGEPVTIAESSHPVSADTLSVACSVPNDTWHFEIRPYSGWISTTQLAFDVLLLLGLPALAARFANAAQCPADAAERLQYLIFPITEAESIPAAWRGKTLLELPRVMFGKLEQKTAARLDALQDAGFAGAVVNNPAQLRLADGWTLYGGLGLNVTNPMSAARYASLGVQGMLLQPETALTAMQAVAPGVPTAALCYGHLPLMLTRACPLRNVRDCGKCPGGGTLRDRKGRDFTVTCSAPGGAGVRTVYNPVPLYMGERLREMPVDVAIAAFTTETPARAAQILAMLLDARPFDNEFTRGLYYTNN